MAWLAQLTEEDVARKPSSTRWSKKEILGHLVDSTCNNHQRFVRAQLASAAESDSSAHGDGPDQRERSAPRNGPARGDGPAQLNRPSQREGHLTFPGYEQEGWARCQRHVDADWGALLALWRLYNLHLARVIAVIPETAAATPCIIGDQPATTLAALVADYISHMEHHLRQLTGTHTAR